MAVRNIIIVSFALLSSMALPTLAQSPNLWSCWGGGNPSTSLDSRCCTEYIPAEDGLFTGLIASNPWRHPPLLQLLTRRFSGRYFVSEIYPEVADLICCSAQEPTSVPGRLRDIVPTHRWSRARSTGAAVRL